MKRVSVLLIAVTIALFALCGCAKVSEPVPSDTVPEKVSFTSIDSTASAVTLTKKTETVSGVTVNYPDVTGLYASKKITGRLKNAAFSLAEMFSGEIKEVTYTVCYNMHGILSILFRATANEGSGERYKALTINTQSADDITLDMLFSEQIVWRKVVSAYVSMLVKLYRTESYAPINIDERKSFCLTDTELIIVCEPYEFTYYRNGAYLFEIPYAVISDYRAEGGAVDIILSNKGE